MDVVLLHKIVQSLVLGIRVGTDHRYACTDVVEMIKRSRDENPHRDVACVRKHNEGRKM